MFDIGFWELAIIMVVALLVVGPERLPGVARKAGRWIGKTRQFVRSVKDDIDREIAAEELHKILKDQSEANPLHEIVETTKETLDSAKQSLQSLERDTLTETTKETLDSAKQSLQSLERDTLTDTTQSDSKDSGHKDQQ